MMTRDDLMRELELLPVWQQRAPFRLQTQAPLQVQEIVTESAQINTTLLITETNMEVAAKQDLVEISSVSELEVIIEPTPISRVLTYILSDDGDWLFVLSSSDISNKEQQLFQNICKALCIKTKPAEVSADALKLIDSFHPKLLLAMGELSAQLLLDSADPIESLRGRIHQLHGVTLIPTYDLVSLLQNPADKAKVWNDLCLGLQTLQNLKVSNP